MPLNMNVAASRGTQLLHQLGSTRQTLDPVRLYWKGRQRLPPVIPRSAPREVREMARLSRVNVCEIVVTSLVQSLIVEGIRASREGQDGERVDELVDPVWNVWQANKLDKRQAGITAAAIAYGHSFATVVPGVRPQDGRRTPLVRGVSPRRMEAVYGDDPDWPAVALEQLGGGRYNLYDSEAIYRLVMSDGRLGPAEESPELHGFGVAPVVRWEAEDDLDQDDEPPAESMTGHGHDLEVDVVMGQVAPLADIQDQIDVITFNLMVAQHYSAFRQRYAIGWTSADEKKAMEFAASTLWAFKDHPDDVRLGEFEQTSLDGYITSREHALKYAATLTQTPVHELIGQMINMAADALAAAEAGRDRKVDSFKISLGESHEQLANLIGTAVRTEVPDDAQIVWKDTSARAFTAVVQGLAQLVQGLGMPPEELWDRVPGFTQQDIRRMRSRAAEGDSLTRLTDMLDNQAAAGGDGGGGGGLLGPDGNPVAA